jgi:hypothetical protein
LWILQDKNCTMLYKIFISHTFSTQTKDFMSLLAQYTCSLSWIFCRWIFNCNTNNLYKLFCLLWIIGNSEELLELCQIAVHDCPNYVGHPDPVWTNKRTYQCYVHTLLMLIKWSYLDHNTHLFVRVQFGVHSSRRMGCVHFSWFVQIFSKLRLIISTLLVYSCIILQT